MIKLSILCLSLTILGCSTMSGEAHQNCEPREIPHSDGLVAEVLASAANRYPEHHPEFQTNDDAHVQNTHQQGSDDQKGCDTMRWTKESKAFTK
ncbi:MAG: hypothetical protein AAGB12_08620 [Pseudomonadota bacterium]